MEPVYYQLFIAATIFFTNLKFEKYLITICWIWTAFTVLNLFYPPLIIIQLGVIWGTFFLVKKDRIKDSQIDDLETVLRKKDQEIQEVINSTDGDAKKNLSGKEHLTFLLAELDEAQHSIFILSGWITSYVVTDSFIAKLRKKLEDGCAICIGYGWQDSTGHHKELNPSANRAISKLEALNDEFPSMRLGKYATHEKLFVVDKKFVVYGSNNWLSNAQFKNHERSLVVYNSDLASNESTRITSLIESAQ